MRQGRRQLDRRAVLCSVFGLLNAALDVANRLGIFVTLTWSRGPSSPSGCQLSVTESRMLLVLPQSASRAARPCCRYRKQLFEHRSRFHSMAAARGAAPESVCV